MSLCSSAVGAHLAPGPGWPSPRRGGPWAASGAQTAADHTDAGASPAWPRELRLRCLWTWTEDKDKTSLGVCAELLLLQTPPGRQAFSWPIFRAFLWSPPQLTWL